MGCWTPCGSGAPSTCGSNWTAQLLAVPVEAGLLASGRAPAPEPGVPVARVSVAVRRPAPGPLKVLVAVGALDEGLTANVPLDIEAEMGSILTAVGPAVADERAQVRVLEVANADTLREALVEDAYHVVHLSGHGSAASIEIEDEDGGAVGTSARKVADAFRASGAAVPLVFLSCMWLSATLTGSSPRSPTCSAARSASTYGRMGST
jgi:hypothetical protein